ncbi:DNA mismatch repair protein MutL [Methylophaga lonarensis MPL]|uniref:DNA mismatch repair protein MutL n=1 Tax=Methylophaga lonarensis MPL TaxID=1286106 RepID=M7NY49_9GAMM|nr:DNA mismatch repair endonuclease MutL [Methylophaga lonarensis]EMR12141.1 DNA mismatch repair protein MutL [Methylophaga lonarensis MPL]
MTTGRIHPLPLYLANQIAAGEVVERPASVVKELVENSIDASADNIEVTIEGAGRQLIRVSDNGTGIHPDDLPLALSRHATSKLSSTEQLGMIASLGFRGEALPSISSVSQLTLHSRQADQPCAWQITTDQDPIPSAHPQGTMVEVRDLFFNIPARRRFLRSDKTEQQHIATTLNRLALSQFDVAFRWQIDKLGAIKLPAAISQPQKLQRIGKICGNSFVRDALYLEQSYQDIDIHGWISPPSAHRAQTDVQYFFINGRVIRDRLINHAIRQAYDGLLPEGRQPGYVLYLTLPLDKIDVNVHPTKHEVRFREARLVHGLITKALQETLNTAQPPQPGFDSPRTTIIQEAAAEYPSKHEARQPSAAEQVITNKRQLSAILHQRYALVDVESEPTLIDLQQAEQILKQIAFVSAISEQTLASRPVLVPLELPCSEAQRLLIGQHQSILSALAFDLRPGQNGLVIKAIPTLLAQMDLRQLVESLLIQLATTNTDPIDIAKNIAETLPLSPVISHAQAEKILSELEGNEASVKHCYRKLDLQSLAGLFSG